MDGLNLEEDLAPPRARVHTLRPCPSQAEAACPSLGKGSFWLPGLNGEESPGGHQSLLWDNIVLEGSLYFQHQAP